MKEKKNKSGFEVPDGYFDSFNKRLSEKLAQPGATFPEQEGFVAPDGYFESFNERLQKRMAGTQTKVIPLQAYKKYFLTAAAVAAIITLYIFMPENSPGQLSFDDLAGNEIALYMEYNDPELTNEEIAQLLSVDELEIGDMMDSQLEEDYIIDYLDSTVDDYNELNMELDE